MSKFKHETKIIKDDGRTYVDITTALALVHYHYEKMPEFDDEAYKMAVALDSAGEYDLAGCVFAEMHPGAGFVPMVMRDLREES